MAEMKHKNYSTTGQQVRFDLIGIGLLCLTYSGGMLLSGFQLIPFGTGNRLRLFLFSWLTVFAGGLFCHFFRKYRMFGSLVPAVGAAVCFFYYGPVRILAGAESLCNVLITGWNLRYEDGIPLMGNGQIREEPLFACYLIFLLLLLSLFWYLAERRACVRTIMLMLACVAPEIILRQSSSLGIVLLVTCTLGTWLLFFQSGSRKRRLIWFFLVGVVLAAVSVFSGKREVPAVLQLQKNILSAVREFRYGSDSLPEGDLNKAVSMQDGEEERLLITTEQIKPLYFQGFTGARYEDGCWKTLKKLAYGGEHWGFLDWLSSQEFDPNAQFFAYQGAGNRNETTVQEEERVPENQIDVENQGANRRYVYTVYSAQRPQTEMLASERDAGYRSRALFGNWNYRMSERSLDIPGELCQLDDWVYSPETEKQQDYLTAESVYRDFVYENYLEISPELEMPVENLLAEPLKEQAASSLQSIYDITQNIRKAMEDHLYYEEIPENPESEDPLAEFLMGNIAGNSAYYASAGVLAFRKFGIPARYAEGYYAGSERIADAENGRVQLTTHDAHAWTEVYMDGMGWIPVDFTPGFYYNTYTLLRMAQLPQNIRKTAAMEDNGEEAENAVGNTPQEKGRENFLDRYEIKPAYAFLGLLLLACVIFEILLACLEISRWYYEYRIRLVFQAGGDGCAEYLCRQIERNLRALGTEVRPGWNAGQTDQAICACLPDIMPGSYIRVNSVLEKYIYGDGTLEPEELRLLYSFLTAVRESRKHASVKKRLLSRYIILLRP